jgi:hypothetical protein
MNFYLVDGEVKFLTHKVEWKERGQIRYRDFYDEDDKNAFVDRLQERNIEYTVTEYEQPSQEILNRVADRKFNTIAEAQAYMDGTLPKSQLEILQETVDTLVLSALEG